MIGNAIVENVRAPDWRRRRAEDVFVETIQLALPGHHLFGQEQHIRMKGAVRLSVPGSPLGLHGSHADVGVHARRHLFRLSQLADGDMCGVGHDEDDDEPEAASLRVAVPPSTPP
jgi:hypothetical protein